jgi:hypothetical protein
VSTQPVRILIAPARRLLLLAGVAVALAACGAETSTDPPRTVAVQPRVIVDGTVELSAVMQQRPGLRAVVDEVLFHAPAVTVQQHDAVIDELLSADDSPLLFRYDAASSDGFGDVLGGERRWAISDVAGELVVAFAPLDARLPVLTELERETGVSLGALHGHTATVHGFLLATAPRASDGDACREGAALCDPGDAASEEKEGDPDGNPSEGDPDGNPAKGDATASEGDPDGNPSHDPESEGERAGQARARAADETVRPTDDRAAVTLVPFTLVLNRAFSLRAPVAGLFHTELADDEVRPLELHVRLDELLSEEMLALLDAEAPDPADGAIVVEIPDAHVGLDVDSKGVEPGVIDPAPTGGIHVVGR